MTEDSGYTLELLREDAGLTLYRGRDSNTLTPIVAVAATVPQPSPHILQRLEHEWSLATALDSAWAARPVALTRHQGRTALILEDPGGEPLDRIITQQKNTQIDLTRCLRIAIGLVAALDQVHRHGLIHRDVKPANTLVDNSGRAWLMGFGIASRVPRERLPPMPPEIVSGTLAYMSPEQTGRMNRSVDSRSDLYSLGVTLYELFTGALPFSASDPMEWVHCHVARQPRLPGEQGSVIPSSVAAIIMRLLAKTAEERYQTAVAVERDFRRCLDDWETHGRVHAFLPGERDVPDRLLIPEKLYGRESEIGVLLESFERVAAGCRPELVLVSGYAGAGKSSVVNELHKALVPPRGFFASGKFDQYKRNIPYATLAEAFQGPVRAILSKGEEELDRWRVAFREALGPNGQLMVDLVPELKLIIGEQLAPPALSSREAQNRFQLVFRRFISVFTRDQPLALFLDDLQWLDAATLDVIEDLVTQPDVERLLLIGAYRNNEVSPEHPLKRKLKAVRRSGVRVSDIVLAPLERSDLEALLADSLHCERPHVGALARLVEAKTRGNPFFVIQFIYAMFEEELLIFDHGRGAWSWDLNRIRDKGYTDNVVDLMVEKLNRLPSGTKKALQQLSCLGISADFATLHVVYQDSIDELHDQLWHAVRMGLVHQLEDSYRFVHDRVQEAAYSLIPQSLRADAHLRIGMLMASRASPQALDEHIFEIVNQLNRGAHLVNSIEERERIAQLNLIAGRRAKTSTVYASAIGYLNAGRELLTDETCDRNDELIFSIESLLAECDVQTANLASAEARLSMLARRATSARDRALITRLRLTLYNLLDRSDRGVDVFIEYQRGRGERWSPHPSVGEVSKEFNQVWSRVSEKQKGELVNLPLVKDADLLDILDVLTEAVLTAQFTDENLHALILCRMVEISLDYGNSDASSFAYVTLGQLAGSRFGNYEAGFQLGKLSYELVEKHAFVRFRARVYMRFGNLIMPWRCHVKTGRDLVCRAFDAAIQSGDLTFAAYSCSNLYTNMLAAGDPLSEVQREAETGLAFAEKLKFGRVISTITTQVMFIRTLRGLTGGFGTFNDDRFDESRFERHLSSNPTLARPECWYWIRKSQARFLANDYESAIDASEHAARLFEKSHSNFEVMEFHFYGALARACAIDYATDELRKKHAQALNRHYRQLRIWATNCPANFENCAALVEAEIARIEGRLLDAQFAYEKAIRSASANGFVHNEATASELAGRFYATLEFDKIARTYLSDARRCYLSWGAISKVEQLDKLYPYLNGHLTTPAFSGTITAPTSLLDLATVIKVSQTLSSEMVLPSLIEKLVRLAVENAGAQRGLLILLRSAAQGGEPRIEAEATSQAGGIDVVVRQSIVTSSDLPQAALDYVIRTQERVLLDDASRDIFYSENDYVNQKRSRSLLCLPILKQAKLIGILYLENSLAAGVFTSDRVELLQLLASQAAISLENAKLYSDLQRSEAFLSQGQKISHTGSFGWNASSGDHYWSEEGYNIIEYDSRVQPSVELVLLRVHPEDRDSVRRALDASWTEKKDFDSKHRFLMPDGRIKYIHASGKAVNIENLDFVGAVRDVTERERAEESLRQAMIDLARINRATTMGEMAASLAHEVSQPISGAIGHASACLRWLSRDKPRTKEARTAATNMVENVRRAAEIVVRIRKQFEKGALNREVFEVGEIVRDTIALLRGEIQRYDVAVRVDLAPDLPRVVGDRVQLQQVAMNLILNGIEAMKDINGLREIVVTAERTGEAILVSIRDTGIGVQSKLAEQIFDPFFTTKPHGTGMGLRISRSIVESHGGQLWISSNMGSGATFQFTLPIREDRDRDSKSQ
ncbi:ATP-binding sensor histidine kinase [Paraburkholderia sp. BL17N1]|uniref:trifunctional serine/threonine-protein kinase/ATP-binding protein/sensor histidine kinase n=1 Tax=Paraburkholderia sp. BL17N1 TaxID=1938798 RepID=UPI000EAE6F1F|nr:ATP-binding sensor histidine kinase [Paraburkholderia sp. BL17N1]RKR36217.1 putative ATPase [Paraburkholderia sp. BL17N1]